MASGVLSAWPPIITDDQLGALTLQAKTYALSHGLVYLPVAEVQPAAPTSTIHAPLALFPSPIPRRLFIQAKRLQRIYNVLYARVASDVEFLDKIMGETGVGKVDEFTGQLWKRLKRLREIGIAQPLQLGLFRSDYMVHLPEGPTGQAELKQVEFNTISSSFGTLSQRASALHRYLYSSTQYFQASSILRAENLPDNTTTVGLAEGLKTAHKAYNTPGAWILFVVQDNERNVFDQRWLEYELLEKHSIHVIRQTLKQLATSASVDPESHILRINSPGYPHAKNVEIAVVYFRAGYTPTDYPTSDYYDTRYLLESSRAIQCPSFQLQLAGGKKVQEVLTRPGILEHFLLDSSRWGPNAEAFTQTDVEDVRASWMEMWSLDADGSQGLQRTRDNALDLVLKPQREGGGNNVYKDAIPGFLDTLPESEREAWIAMRLIKTPQGLGNYLVRAGGAIEGVVKSEVISELGIFGWALFGGPDGRVDEKEVGWLLRTKGKESNEGGVAAGFSVLDSVVLVD